MSDKKKLGTKVDAPKKDKVDVAENKKEVKSKTEDKVDKKKPSKDKIDGRKIGTTLVNSVIDKTINGTDYKVVNTIDGLTFTLSEEDFNNQVSK